VLLGGAALNRAYVEVDLRGIYEGPLFYCKDAFSGLQQMDELVEHREKGGAPPEWGRVIAERKQGRTAGADTVEADTSEVVAPQVALDVGVPTPPFWGSRVTRGIALDEIGALLNKRALFRNQWPSRGAAGPAGRPRLLAGQRRWQRPHRVGGTRL
jgi:5-methyltetrahydrofolate--homocysteine methyltransferase